MACGPAPGGLRSGSFACHGLRGLARFVAGLLAPAAAAAPPASPRRLLVPSRLVGLGRFGRHVGDGLSGDELRGLKQGARSPRRGLFRRRGLVRRRGLLLRRGLLPRPPWREPVRPAPQRLSVPLPEVPPRPARPSSGRGEVSPRPGAGSGGVGSVVFGWSSCCMRDAPVGPACGARAGESALAHHGRNSVGRRYPVGCGGEACGRRRPPRWASRASSARPRWRARSGSVAVGLERITHRAGLVVEGPCASRVAKDDWSGARLATRRRPARTSSGRTVGVPCRTTTWSIAHGGVELLTAKTTPRVDDDNGTLVVTVPSIDVHEVIAINL